MNWEGSQLLTLNMNQRFQFQYSNSNVRPDYCYTFNAHPCPATFPPRRPVHHPQNVFPERIGLLPCPVPQPTRIIHPTTFRRVCQSAPAPTQSFIPRNETHYHLSGGTSSTFNTSTALNLQGSDQKFSLNPQSSSLTHAGYQSILYGMGDVKRSLNTGIDQKITMSSETSEVIDEVVNASKNVLNEDKQRDKSEILDLRKDLSPATEIEKKIAVIKLDDIKKEMPSSTTSSDAPLNLVERDRRPRVYPKSPRFLPQCYKMHHGKLDHAKRDLTQTMSLIAKSSEIVDHDDNATKTKRSSVEKKALELETPSCEKTSPIEFYAEKTDDGLCTDDIKKEIPASANHDDLKESDQGSILNPESSEFIPVAYEKHNFGPDDSIQESDDIGKGMLISALQMTSKFKSASIGRKDESVTHSRETQKDEFQGDNNQEEEYGTPGNRPESLHTTSAVDEIRKKWLTSIIVDTLKGKSQSSAVKQEMPSINTVDGDEDEVQDDEQKSFVTETFSTEAPECTENRLCSHADAGEIFIWNNVKEKQEDTFLTYNIKRPLPICTNTGSQTENDEHCDQNGEKEEKSYIVSTQTDNEIGATRGQKVCVNVETQTDNDRSKDIDTAGPETVSLKVQTLVSGDLPKFCPYCRGNLLRPRKVDRLIPSSVKNEMPQPHADKKVLTNQECDFEVLNTKYVPPSSSERENQKDLLQSDSKVNFDLEELEHVLQSLRNYSVSKKSDKHTSSGELLSVKKTEVDSLHSRTPHQGNSCLGASSNQDEKECLTTEKQQILQTHHGERNLLEKSEFQHLLPEPEHIPAKDTFDVCRLSALLKSTTNLESIPPTHNSCHVGSLKDSCDTHPNMNQTSFESIEPCVAPSIEKSVQIGTGNKSDLKKTPPVGTQNPNLKAKGLPPPLKFGSKKMSKQCENVTGDKTIARRDVSLLNIELPSKSEGLNTISEWQSCPTGLPSKKSLDVTAVSKSLFNIHDRTNTSIPSKPSVEERGNVTDTPLPRYVFDKIDTSNLSTKVLQSNEYDKPFQTSKSQSIVDNFVAQSYPHGTKTPPSKLISDLKKVSPEKSTLKGKMPRDLKSVDTKHNSMEGVRRPVQMSHQNFYKIKKPVRFFTKKFRDQDIESSSNPYEWQLVSKWRTEKKQPVNTKWQKFQGKEIQANLIKAIRESHPFLSRAEAKQVLERVFNETNYFDGFRQSQVLKAVALIVERLYPDLHKGKAVGQGAKGCTREHDFREDISSMCSEDDQKDSALWAKFVSRNPFSTLNLRDEDMGQSRQN